MQTKTSTLLEEYLIHTRDKSDANVLKGKERMDYYYTFLLSEANNYVVERTKYGRLKANQRSFLLPPDYIKMKRVRVKINNKWYKLTPTISLDNWADATEMDTTSSIPIEWTVINEQGNMHIELSDIPNADSATLNFEIIYEGYQDPLFFPEDYVTGTVTIDQGSASVAGDETVFTEDMAGRFLKVTGGKNWYEIKAVAAEGVATLVNYFQEADVEDVGFIIAELPRLPMEYHKTPLWGAVSEYYKPNNAKKSAEYEGWYARDLLLLQNKYKSKTKGRVTPGKRVGGGTGRVPRNYPNGAIG